MRRTLMVLTTAALTLATSALTSVPVRALPAGGGDADSRAPDGIASCAVSAGRPACVDAEELAALLTSRVIPEAGLLSISVDQIRDENGRITAIRITIRVWDVRTEQTRQITVVQDL